MKYILFNSLFILNHNNIACQLFSEPDIGFESNKDVEKLKEQFTQIDNAKSKICFCICKYFENVVNMQIEVFICFYYYYIIL